DFVANAAKIIELMKTSPSVVSKRGVPWGMNRAQAEEAWAKARDRAEEFFSTMVEKGIVPEIDPADYERVLLTDDAGKVHTVLVPKTDEAKAAVALKEAMV